eukprot:Hpha_TRINITY_DN16002_c2_g11::TRINITY_DN16002_c2_g11_i1::g.122096::m.122096
MAGKYAMEIPASPCPPAPSTGDPRGGTVQVSAAHGSPATEMKVVSITEDANGVDHDLNGVDESPLPELGQLKRLDSMCSIESAGPDGRLSKEATTSALIEILGKEARKISLYRSLPIYTMFIFCITLSFLLFESDHKHGYKYNVAASTRNQLLQGARFTTISSSKDFYNWMRNLYPLFQPNATTNETSGDTLTSPERHADPLRAGPGSTGGTIQSVSELLGKKAGALGTTHGLAYMVMRQRRQNRQLCERTVQVNLFANPNQTRWEDMVREGKGDASAGVCYGNARADFWNNTVKPEPKTWPENLLDLTTNPFEVDYTKTNLPRMVPVIGLSGDRYSDDDEEFTMLLPYGELTEADLYQVIDSLEAQTWIDAATRVVVVHALFYNPDEDVFVCGQLVAEFLVAGELDALARVHALRYLAPQANAALAAVFAIDIISSFFIVVASIDLYQAISLNAKVDPLSCSVGFWEVLSIVQLGVQLTAYVIRFVRWSNGFNIPSGLSGPALLTELESERLLQEVATELYAWMLFLSWMKVFGYLRYNKRLNALVEVVRLAIPELISMLIAGLMVNLPFMMLVHTVYGDEIEAVRSIQATFWFLFRNLIETNLSDYDEMDPIAPVTTGLFYVLFLAINWFILLNMVLGILASSFAAVQESVESISWAVPELLADTRELAAQIFSSVVEREAIILERRVSVSNIKVSPVWSRVAMIEKLREHEADLNLSTAWIIGEPVFLTAAAFEGLAGGVITRSVTDDVFKAALHVVSSGAANERKDRINQIMYSSITDLRTMVSRMAPAVNWMHLTGMPGAASDRAQHAQEVADHLTAVKEATRVLMEEQMAMLKEQNEKLREQLSTIQSLGTQKLGILKEQHEVVRETSRRQTELHETTTKVAETTEKSFNEQQHLLAASRNLQQGVHEAKRHSATAAAYATGSGSPTGPGSLARMSRLSHDAGHIEELARLRARIYELEGGGSAFAPRESMHCLQSGARLSMGRRSLRGDDDEEDVTGMFGVRLPGSGKNSPRSGRSTPKGSTA